MSTAAMQDESEDEFESADEGESISAPIVKSNVPPPSDPITSSINENLIEKTSLSPVTDG
ncbi:unnamed protein product, partial [Rotaria sp. Silwood1]